MHPSRWAISFHALLQGGESRDAARRTRAPAVRDADEAPRTTQNANSGGLRSRKLYICTCASVRWHAPRVSKQTRQEHHTTSPTSSCTAALRHEAAPSVHEGVLAARRELPLPNGAEIGNIGESPQTRGLECVHETRELAPPML